MPLSAEDRVAIGEVIARYCHATDAGDGPGVAEQFTDDGILEIAGEWQARGRAQIAQIGAFPNKPRHWVSTIVIEGNGSTAQATSYYASVSPGGPLNATGVYRSQLTRQLNGSWRLVHHCYTRDAQNTRPPPKRDPKALAVEDRLAIIELAARYSQAFADRDAAAAARLFAEDGVFEASGQPQVRGRAALEQAFAAELRQLDDVREWTTNHIVEGDVECAQLRAYYLRLRGDQVVATGKFTDTLTKRGGSFEFVRRTLTLDSRSAR